MSRALVLSGGGSVGAAWETGLAAGLIGGGVALTEADLVLGTSAGSSVGVQVAAGHDMDQQVERYRAARAKAAAGRPTAVLNVERSEFRGDLFERGWAVGRQDASLRLEIGRVALEASTISEEAFLATFRYLKGQPWPAAYVCTCLEAESGDPVALDQELGAELDRGVAASCAIPGVYPPIAIGARHYLDGGVLSPTYLDLAADHDRILFVNMVTVPPSELAAVERAGATLLRVEPDEASWNAMGENRMDASRAFDAVERGLQQGRQIAQAVADFWG